MENGDETQLDEQIRANQELLLKRSYEIVDKMTAERTRIPVITAGFILAIAAFAAKGEVPAVSPVVMSLAIVGAAYVGIAWIGIARDSFQVIERRIRHLYKRMSISEGEHWREDYGVPSESVFHDAKDHWRIGRLVIVSSAIVGILAVWLGNCKLEV